jgi:hypothetical protein
MRKHYDFSQAKPNPYAKRLKKEVTLRLDERTVDYFEGLSEETGIPSRMLIILTCICVNAPQVGSGWLFNGSLRHECRSLTNPLHPTVTLLQF